MSYNKNAHDAGFITVTLIMWGAVILGYALNLYHVVQAAMADNAALTVKLVLQFVGIFMPPVGVILGYVFF